MTTRGWLVGWTCLMAVAACAVVVGMLRGRGVEPPRVRTLELPAAPVRHGAARPMWTVALFVDFTTPASRQAFSQVTRAVGEGLLVDGPAELRLLHAPAGGCEAEALSGFACVAARTIECAERMSPGTGVRLAGEVFDLQWDAATRGDVAAMMGAATRTGLDGAGLARCVADDGEVLGRIGVHATFAADRGLPAAPGGFLQRAGVADRVAPFAAEVTAELLRSLSEALAREEAG